MAIPQTQQDYTNSLAANRPPGMPAPNLGDISNLSPDAQKLLTSMPTGVNLDSGTQGLIEGQMARGAYNPGGYTAHDTDQLMEGVGKDYGLIGKPSGNSMAIAGADDFYDSANARSRDAIAGTVNRIRANDQFMEPMRRAKQQADASANIAKSESLRFNNWVLQNKQQLMKLQLQQAQEAQKKSFLGSLLGLGGAIVGGGIGLAVGGPAGAVAGAGVGMGLGQGTGNLAG